MSLGQKYFIGIDSGSIMCKTVLSANDHVIDIVLTKTSWSPRQSATDCLDSILAKQPHIKRDDVTVAATGYGREAIDFAEHVFTEITCHAYGGMYLSPQIDGIIDIGGQDSKVIQLQNKRVVNFLMNDKCAAGTGRFLSMACDAMGISLEDIDEFVHSQQAIAVNSMCTVFAESEVVSLIAEGTPPENIIRGLHDSIAKRVAGMAGRLNIGEPFAMTGGVAKNAGVVDSLKKILKEDIFVPSELQIAGALGAALLASEMIQ